MTVDERLVPEGGREWNVVHNLRGACGVRMHMGTRRARDILAPPMALAADACSVQMQACRISSTHAAPFEE